jgi:hypothetical protein
MNTFFHSECEWKVQLVVGKRLDPCQRVCTIHVASMPHAMDRG